MAKYNSSDLQLLARIEAKARARAGVPLGKNEKLEELLQPIKVVKADESKFLKELEKLREEFNKALKEVKLKAGKDGRPGLTGKPGRDGVGKPGKDGINGVDGRDGKDGVSVVEAEITFDNHLVITLSDGNEIDAGEIHIESSNNVVQAVQVRGAEQTVTYTTRYDQVSDTLAYKGEALVGSLDANPVWRVQKLVFNSEGDVTITWANGTADFRFVWNDRASFTYI